MRELQRLELVLNMIKTLEAERDAIASTGTSLTHANAKKIQDLIRPNFEGWTFDSVGNRCKC